MGCRLLATGVRVPTEGNEGHEEETIGWNALYIDGELQPFFEQSSNHRMFDLSGYAGQEVELRISAVHPGQEHFIDNLQFVVPEPSTKALFALGAAMAAAAFWRSRRRQ
jgi:hypothetical protein